MAPSERDFDCGTERMNALRQRGHATRARYDRRTRRVVVGLNNGVQIAFPPHLAEGLIGASEEELSDIEITPAGLGLHWPKLDADVYVPALMNGIFGSKRWMAAELGAAGGRASTPAKAAAARDNGLKGGRPRRSAVK